jgi:hypothetical protein
VAPYVPCGMPGPTRHGNGIPSSWHRTPRRSQLVTFAGHFSAQLNGDVAWSTKSSIRVDFDLRPVAWYLQTPALPTMPGRVSPAPKPLHKAGNFPSCNQMESGSRFLDWRPQCVCADEAPEGASSTGWRPDPRRLMPARGRSAIQAGVSIGPGPGRVMTFPARDYPEECNPIGQSVYWL